MDINELKALAATLSEDDAVRLATLFDRQFGWTGVTYTRRDAEDAYRKAVGDDTAVGGDKYWQYLQDSYDWHLAVRDALAERAWEIIDNLAREYVGRD